MARSSEFGGDAATVAANTPTTYTPTAADLAASQNYNAYVPTAADLAASQDYNAYVPTAADRAAGLAYGAAAAASTVTGPVSGGNTGSNTGSNIVPGSTGGNTGSTGGYGPTGSQKTVIGSNIAVINGRNVQVVTYSDGTSQQTDLGTTTNQGSAIAALESTFAAYGITGMASSITNLVQQGYDANAINMVAQDPTSQDPLAVAYRARFSGNTERIKQGLAPLDPATYLATENQYKQVMLQAGLPPAATDPAILGQLIGKDVSPAETQMRVNAAMSALQSEDPQVIAQLQSQYGLSQGALALHLLDPSLAANIVQQQVTAAQIGAEAARAGANVSYAGTGPMSAMSLAAQGVTQQQAQQGFQQIAQQQPALQGIASRYAGYGTPAQVGGELGAATFNTEGAAQAQAQLNRMKQQEISAFSGSAGASTGSLGVRDTSGQL